MRHFDFIINEGYPEAQKEFAVASGDPATATQLITQFRTLVSKNQVQGNERNIDWWRKQGWQPFSKFVSQKSQEPTKTQVKRQKVAGRSITIMENDQWLVVIPLDKEASCFHGKNSDWCTTKQFQPYFENYFYNRGVTLVYCLQKQTGGMWAIAAHRKLEGKWEIFDQQDRSITDGEFTKQTGLDVKSIVDVALGDVHQPEVEKSRVGYTNSIDKTQDLMSQYRYSGHANGRSPEIEKELLYNKDPELCYDYMLWYATAAGQNRATPYSIDSSDFPEAIAVAGIQHDVGAVSVFKNPTERMQMAVIQEDPFNIRILQNPTPRVQFAAVNSDLGAAQYIKNPDPELFTKFPELNKLLRFMPDDEYMKFLPRVHDLIQEAMDEILYDWESRDDYFREWQGEQARQLGYLLNDDGTPFEGDIADLEDGEYENMEIDWDRVHEDDDLNNYIEYSDDARYFYRDTKKVLDNITPANIREWTNEYIDEGYGDLEAPEVNQLERVLAWKFKEQDVESMGNLIDEKLYVHQNVERFGTGKYVYKVEWVRN
ncbi:hypothetical protein UFOVP257_219 [uncultured Caudovirales phage]|uniref:Uncharacterized protein n=1 Tax=uncultured Caudovirales phage TaxID=2100421 RepID=A0A6J5LH30_9CAUD|nr:hypothetical protein UFOVP257_219 [uncultured Caudovirales phage]